MEIREMCAEYKKGFTLIELSLSMVFVGLLALAIALIIGDTSSSYQRGLTLNQINTTGMDVVDEMRTAVQNSSARQATTDCEKYYDVKKDPTSVSNCVADGGFNFIYWVKYANVTVNGKTSNMPIYGAFCTGSYSFIWNSGYYESADAEFGEKVSGQYAKLKYNLSGVGVTTLSSTSVDSSRPFRLVKVRDDYRGVCAGVMRNSSNAASAHYTAMNGILPAGFNGTFDMTDYGSVDPSEPPVEVILTDKSYDLALYDLFVARPAESVTGRSTLYSASFILGTIGGGINITAKGRTCAAPSDAAVSDLEYCAINKFNFTVQVGNE